MLFQLPASACRCPRPVARILGLCILSLAVLQVAHGAHWPTPYGLAVENQAGINAVDSGASEQPESCFLHPTLPSIQPPASIGQRPENGHLPARGLNLRPSVPPPEPG